MFKSKNKKSNVSVSIQWVFMIIVGSFFIFLSYQIIDKFIENENIKERIELQNQLRTVFNDFGRTTGTERDSVAKLDNLFRDREIEIVCNDNISILVIDGDADANNDYLRSYPTFMTFIGKKDVDVVYMATESFRLPYKTTNMLAIISKKNLVVFDNSSQIGQDFQKKFKKSSYNDLNYVSYNFADSSTKDKIENLIDKQNIDTVMLVTDYDGTPKTAVFDIEDDLGDKRAFRIEVEKTTSQYGKIHYYSYTSSNYKPIEYVDYDESLSILTMAIFSSPETFYCSYNMIIDSSLMVTDFYIKKTDFFILSNEQLCMDTLPKPQQQALYSTFKTGIQGLQNEIKNNKFNNPANIINNIDNMNVLYKGIEENNCPYIY